MEIFNQFGVQPVLLAAQVVNFLILLFILKKFLYKPIQKVLDERKKRIEDSLKNAEEIEQRLLRTQEESDKIIAKALKEAQNILDQTNETSAQILDGANKQAERILQRATEDGKAVMEMQKDMLMRQVRENAGNLIALVFQKVISKKITKQDQIDYIEKEVKNLS